MSWSLKLVCFAIFVWQGLKFRSSAFPSSLPLPRRPPGVLQGVQGEEGPGAGQGQEGGSQLIQPQPRILVAVAVNLCSKFGFCSFLETRNDLICKLGWAFWFTTKFCAFEMPPLYTFRPFRFDMCFVQLGQHLKTQPFLKEQYSWPPCPKHLVNCQIFISV